MPGQTSAHLRIGDVVDSREHGIASGLSEAGVRLMVPELHNTGE